MVNSKGIIIYGKKLHQIYCVCIMTTHWVLHICNSQREVGGKNWPDLTWSRDKGEQESVASRFCCFVLHQRKDNSNYLIVGEHSGNRRGDLKISLLIYLVIYGLSSICFLEMDLRLHYIPPPAALVYITSLVLNSFCVWDPLFWGTERTEVYLPFASMA